MGMQQRRCPRCGKKRRRAETKNTAPDKRWKFLEGMRICWICVAQLATLKESDRSP